MIKIGIINGPNLNMLGKRDKKIYGNITLEEINHKLKTFAEREGIELIIRQSNFEGEIIEFIQQFSSLVKGEFSNCSCLYRTNCRIWLPKLYSRYPCS